MQVNVWNPTTDEIREFDEWAATRPPVIKEMTALFKPWVLYRMTDSGHRVVIYSYSENRTMTVAVLAKYNKVAFERRVFGIAPENLTECDLPTPDEPVGARYTTDNEIDSYLGRLRESGAFDNRTQPN